MKYTFLISALAFLFLGSQAWAQASNTVTRDTSKGKVLVNEKGMTLYTFDKDASGKSMCNGTCAQNWLPMMAGAKPVADGDWTPVTRDDGSKMWAYKGKPVYSWINDKAPGDTTGDGANGGTWHVAKP
jgi:predicted lipoprotein with Yx(FWY)xxD motif